MSLTSKQRAALRGAANTMDPVYQIGKGEIDETLIQGIADCIAARELIKVKVLENSEYDPRQAADILCEAVGCECVQVIGRKFVLFKQKKRKAPTPLCWQNEDTALRRHLRSAPQRP